MSYITNREFLLEVRKGNVDGHSMVSIRGFDRNLTTTKLVIHPEGGTTNINQSSIDRQSGTPSVVKVASTSANDTNAGTGMRTCTLSGLDANGVAQSEVIVMNGTTEVTSSLTYSAVTGLLAKVWGSTTYNEGLIYVGTGVFTAGVPATPMFVMDIESNIGHTGYYVVPAGYTLFPIEFYAGIAGSTKYATIYLSTSENGTNWIDVEDYSVTSNAPLNIREHNFSSEIAEDTHVVIKAKAGGANTDITTRWTCVLIDNDFI